MGAWGEGGAYAGTVTDSRTREGKREVHVKYDPDEYNEDGEERWEDVDDMDAPIVALADRIRESAIAITTTAHAHGLLRAFPAEISALVVIGASERLVLATLNGRIAHPERLPEQVTQLVLEGLAGDR